MRARSKSTTSQRKTFTKPEPSWAVPQKCLFPWVRRAVIRLWTFKSSDDLCRLPKCPTTRCSYDFTRGAAYLTSLLVAQTATMLSLVVEMPLPTRDTGCDESNSLGSLFPVDKEPTIHEAEVEAKCVLFEGSRLSVLRSELKRRRSYCGF